MQLKEKHKEWLLNRGITESTIEAFDIHSAYNKIVIPIKDASGITLYNKYRRDPEETIGPKYTYDRGATIKLFNISCLSKAKRVIICEGELDAILLISMGFDAVTSTGGAMSFQTDWVPFFKDKEIFVCMDNDEAGMRGVMKVCEMMSEAKVLPLPPDSGIKDITDFFRKYDKSFFVALMKVALPFPFPTQKKEEPKRTPRTKSEGTRIQKAKDVPLTDFLIFSNSGKAACPFHSDKTPSLQLYKNNTWYCFSCGAGRDTIDFIMKREDMNFTEAVNYLLK